MFFDAFSNVNGSSELSISDVSESDTGLDSARLLLFFALFLLSLLLFSS